jgi:hypothetical protein
MFFTLLIVLSFLLIYFGIHNSKRNLFTQPHRPLTVDITQSTNSPVHIYIALCDYFEPFSGDVSQEIAEHRVVTWCKEYSRTAKLHHDSSGKFPVHTLFYSEEDYNPQLLDILNRLYKQNLADIEMMLPVTHEPLDNFKRKVEEFRDVLFHHHGFLRKGADEKITYGFSHRFKTTYTPTINFSISEICDRIQILIDTGCFADFTYLSKKNRKYLNSQLNSIVRSKDTKTKDYSAPIFPQNWTIKNLLTIQDPYTLKWNADFLRIFPFLENGEISAFKKFLPFRANLWLQNCIGVEADIRHLFIKLHTFGGLDQNIRYLFGESGLHLLWNYMEKLCSYNNFVLHYVSAWEMYRSINSICLLNIQKNRNTSTTL